MTRDRTSLFSLSVDPPAPSVRPADARAGWWTRGTFYVLFVGNAWLVLLFWWVTSGSQPVGSFAEELNALGRVTALLGTYLVLWQLLLMARVPMLERAFGMERLVRFHRWNTYPALGLIFAHAALQTAGYARQNGIDVFAQLGDFVLHYDGLLMAVAGLVLMVVVAVLSVAIVRQHLSYETWYFVHLYAYLAVALAFVHELATGIDLLGNWLFAAYWWALYAVVVGALVVYRVGAPLARLVRHDLRVQRVVKEAPRVVSVYVTGRDLATLTYEPGQFMIWRFLDRASWWEAHPFTLSTPPDGRTLRLTAKSIGDFSARVARVRPGTRVLVEGPFGHFTLAPGARRRALLVAGGIGITPIRALAEQMGTAGIDVQILYRAKRERDVAFRHELEALAAAYPIRIEYLLSDRPTRGRPAREWFRPQNLLMLVPDLREREVYVCGPIGMTEEVTHSLALLQFPPERVHTEAFRF